MPHIGIQNSSFLVTAISPARLAGKISVSPTGCENIALFMVRCPALLRREPRASDQKVKKEISNITIETARLLRIRLICRESGLFFLSFSI